MLSACTRTVPLSRPTLSFIAAASISVAFLRFKRNLANNSGSMKFGSLSWYSFWIHSSTTSFELAAGGGRVVWEFTVSASPVSQSLTGSSATTSPRPRPYPTKFRRGSNLVTNRAPDRFWKRPECRFDFLFASASDHSLTPLPPSPSAARFWNRPRCTSANVWFPLIFGFVTSLWFSSHTRDSQLPFCI